MTVELYTDCPGNGGILIPGSTFTWTGAPDDGFVCTLALGSLLSVTPRIEAERWERFTETRPLPTERVKHTAIAALEGDEDGTGLR